jgi:predicted TIM-barrel fold metal-dependent hydrolase
MILGGVFDRHPKLRIVTGHLGEGMLYAMKRLDTLLPQEITGLEYPVSEYMKTRIFYTISGYNFEPQFMAMYHQVGPGQIMFSSDYPYVSMKETREFVENLPISNQDKQAVFSGNAEKLFRL